MPLRYAEALWLAENKQWEELVRLVRGPEGPARASETPPWEHGRLALHRAVEVAPVAPVEVVRALLDAYPQGAQAKVHGPYGGALALHLAAENGALTCRL